MLTKPSKNLLEKQKKIQDNAASFINGYREQLNENLENEKAEKENKLLSDARLTFATGINRSKNRRESLREEIEYTKKSTLIGMTEMVSQVVEESLLFDTDQYAVKNPEYKEEIREIVSGLLENGNINEKIDNEETLQLVEHVAHTLPNVKDGKNLTEDEISKYIAANTPEDIDASIKALSRNVSGRVASLMEKEQKKAKKIEEEVAKAKGEPVEEEVVEQEEMPVEEQMPAPEENVQPEEEMAQEQPTEEVQEMPVEGNSDEEVAQPQQGKNIHIAADGTTSISMPNGQLSLNGDGSMDIQLMESFIEEIFNEEDSLNEKFNVEKYQTKLVDKEVGIRRGPGPLLLFLFGSVLGVGTSGINWGLIRGSNNQRLSGKAKAMLDIISKDPKCRKIIKKIEIEINNKKPDKELLKKYKAELKSAVKEVASDVRLGNYSQRKRYALAESLVRETQRSGLIESLAVNEAMNMISQGKEYDSDLCLAKALTYVTVLEALDEMGIMPVCDNDYCKVISAAGGKPEKLEKEIAKKFQPVKKEIEGVTFPKENNCVKKTEKKSREVESLTEGIIATQYTPIMNKKNPNDLAERLRNKRLAEERNLNE